MAARATGGAVVLGLAEIGTGAALLLAPARLLGPIEAAPPDRRVRLVARVLGTRYLVQGLATAVHPSRRVLRLGATADGLHGASMVLAAAARLGPPRLALASAAGAGAFAAVAVAQSSRR